LVNPIVMLHESNAGGQEVLITKLLGFGFLVLGFWFDRGVSGHKSVRLRTEEGQEAMNETRN